MKKNLTLALNKNNSIISRNLPEPSGQDEPKRFLADVTESKYVYTWKPLCFRPNS